MIPYRLRFESNNMQCEQ